MHKGQKFHHMVLITNFHEKLIMPSTYIMMNRLQKVEQTCWSKQLLQSTMINVTNRAERRNQKNKMLTCVSLPHSSPEAAPDSYAEHDQWLQLQLEILSLPVLCKSRPQISAIVNIIIIQKDKHTLTHY
jgi:hypothetical protein